MSATIRIVQERRNASTFWTLEIGAGVIMPTDVDDFIADLRTAVTKVDELNHSARKTQ